jgi:hypothetical protein
VSPKGPGEREWHAVAEVIRELSETIRAPDRRERMRRLLEAAAKHYHDAGELEPAWMTTARRLFEGEGEHDGGS